MKFLLENFGQKRILNIPVLELSVLANRSMRDAQKHKKCEVFKNALSRAKFYVILTTLNCEHLYACYFLKRHFCDGPETVHDN